MNIDLLLLAAVDGLSFAGLLFLISLGLTLICGVFGVINVAHGSLYARTRLRDGRRKGDSAAAWAAGGMDRAHGQAG